MRFLLNWHVLKFVRQSQSRCPSWKLTIYSMKQLNFIRIELTHFDFSRERSKYVFDKWFEQIRFNFVPYLNQTGRKQEKKTFIKRVCVASICIFRLENTFSTIETDFFGFSSARRKKWKKKKDTPNF